MQGLSVRENPEFFPRNKSGGVRQPPLLSDARNQPAARQCSTQACLRPGIAAAEYAVSSQKAPLRSSRQEPSGRGCRDYESHASRRERVSLGGAEKSLPRERHPSCPCDLRPSHKPFRHGALPASAESTPVSSSVGGLVCWFHPSLQLHGKSLRIRRARCHHVLPFSRSESSLPHVRSSHRGCHRRRNSCGFRSAASSDKRFPVFLRCGSRHRNYSFTARFLSGRFFSILRLCRSCPR